MHINRLGEQIKRSDHICDLLCENPAKVIFLWFAVFYKKNILHMVKNIL